MGITLSATREALVRLVGTHSTASLIHPEGDRLGRSGMRPTKHSRLRPFSRGAPPSP
jgi:hypothetical protein